MLHSISSVCKNNFHHHPAYVSVSRCFELPRADEAYVLSKDYLVGHACSDSISRCCSHLYVDFSWNGTIFHILSFSPLTSTEPSKHILGCLVGCHQMPNNRMQAWVMLQEANTAGVLYVCVLIPVKQCPEGCRTNKLYNDWLHQPLWDLGFSRVAWNLN